MTEPPGDEPRTPVDDDLLDELASAVVDDAATDDERATVADHPRGASRVDELRSLRSDLLATRDLPTSEGAVGGQAPVDAVAAALDRIEAEADGTGPRLAPVPRPSRRGSGTVAALGSRRRGGVPAIITGAAAALLLIAGLGLVVLQNGSSDEQAGTAAESTRSAPQAAPTTAFSTTTTFAPPAADSSAGARPEGPIALATADTPDLGDATDPSELVERAVALGLTVEEPVEDAPATSAPAQDRQGEATLACRGTPVATGRVAGVPVTLVDDAGVLRVLTATCVEVPTG
jgi:hypothetical protein